MAHPSSESRPPHPPPTPPPPPPTSQSSDPGGDPPRRPPTPTLQSRNAGGDPSRPPPRRPPLPRPTSPTRIPAGDPTTVQRRSISRRSEIDIESGLPVTSDASPPPRQSFNTASVRDPPPSTYTSILATYRSRFLSLGEPASRPRDHHHRDEDSLPISREETTSNRSIRTRLSSCFASCNCFPHVDPPISTKLSEYFRSRKCLWLVLFLVYYVFGVAVFWIVQTKSISSSKGPAFGGGSNNTFIDANYFTVVTLTSIGFGDVYPAREGIQRFISFYIFIGILLLGVVSVIISRSLEDFEDWFLDLYVVECIPWVLQGRPVGQARGRWLGFKVFYTFVLSLAAMLIISIHGGLYLVLTSVTTVGYGNVAFQTPEDRSFAAKSLFFGVLLYGRLVSLLGEYFGSPNAEGA